MAIKLPPGTAAHSTHSPPPKGRQIVTLLMIGAGLIVMVWVTLGFVFNHLIQWIPPGVERQLGRSAIATFEQLAEPSPTQDSLNQLLDRLEAELPPDLRQEREYQLLYVPEETVNALALPGDYIVIFEGLLAQATSENEVMMVLGHELGHFAHRDHLRGLGRSLVVRVVLSVLFGDGGSLAAWGLETFTQTHFSRQQETRADEFGLTLLQRTYGHVAGAMDFFDRLSQQTGVTFDLFTTHPAPRKRVQRLEQLIQQRQYEMGAITPLPPSLQVGE